MDRIDYLEGQVAATKEFVSLTFGALIATRGSKTEELGEMFRKEVSLALRAKRHTAPAFHEGYEKAVNDITTYADRISAALLGK